MNKKTIQPMTVLKFTMQTTMATFLQDIGDIPCKIEAKITELGLTPTGPHTWVYSGCDGCEGSPFMLDICVPVDQKKGDAGMFSFDVLPEFDCVSTDYPGPWSELAKAYETFIPEVTKNGFTMSGVGREVYRVCDFENPANCITEIQIGV